MLVRKILTKNPAAGSSGDSASGVFGGGKGDKYVDLSTLSYPLVKNVAHVF